MLGVGVSHHLVASGARQWRDAAGEPIVPPDLAVEMRPLSALAGIIESWRALAACALEPNIFHEPAFALAAAPVLGANVQAHLVWSQSQPRELLGLFPVRVQPRRYGVPLPVLCGWTHPFAPFGPPLVHRDHAEPVLAAWFDHIEGGPGRPGLLLMPYVSDDGAFATVLDAVLARRGSAWAAYDRHERALLAPPAERADYLNRNMTRKRRRELARQWRRLEEIGSLALDAAIGAAAEPALQDFLRIEASGWKGRAGSAAASDKMIRHFFAHAVTALAAQSQAAIYRLLLDGTAIAAIITLRSGAAGWCWKIAYDENYARSSPGAQLLVKVTQDLLHDGSLARTDSLATADHPLIDHIWRERLSVSDRLIAVRPHSSVSFTVACRLESARRRGIGAARALRRHLRGRRGRGGF